MCIHEPTLEKDQTGVHAPGLVETVKEVSRPFVDAHHADIRACPQGLFEASNREIRVGIGAARTGVHIHYAQFQTPDLSGQLGAAVYRDLIPGEGIDTNLTTKKQLIPVAQGKVENSGIFQEKLTFLGDEHFERCEIEWFQVHVRVSKIRVGGQVQYKVGAETVFHVDSARQRELRVLPGLLVISREAIRLHDEESSAANVFNAFEVSRLRNFRNPEGPAVRLP